MTKRRALIDIAYDVLSKKRKPMPFKNLWLETIESANLKQDEAQGQIGQFYSDMSLDSRFVSLSENKWDLKKRYKFEETYVVLDDLDTDEDEMDEYYDEDEENSDLNHDEEEEDY